MIVCEIGDLDCYFDSSLTFAEILSAVVINVRSCWRYLNDSQGVGATCDFFFQ